MPVLDPAPGPSPVYASGVDYVAAGYAEPPIGDELNLWLRRAEVDLDRLFALIPIITTGTYAGRRFDPTTLLPYQAAALADATVIQARHRYLRGPVGEEVRRTKRVKGPDFEQEFADGETAGTGRYSADLEATLEPLAPYRARFARARA